MSDEPEVTAESLLATASAIDAGTYAEKSAAAPAAKDDKVEPDENSEADAGEPVVTKEKSDDSKADKAKDQKTDAEKQKSKWAQNEERKAKTWQEINADKEAIKAEREALQRERDEFQKVRVKTEVLRDEHNASAKDYRDAAAQFQAAGDNAMAAEAEKLATALDAKEQTLKQQQAAQEGQAKWMKNLETLTVKHPDLAKADSALAKAAMQVLETFPALKRDPDGIKYAVRAAEIELQAKEFDGTKAEFAKLKEQHAALQKKLQISGGSPTDPIPPSKSFKDLSLKDQRRSLERAADQHDRDNNLSD